MCLAVPGQLIECEEERALVDFQGNRLWISRVLTPDTRPGDWVLVHAGFSISKLEKQDALDTWDYLRESYGPQIDNIASPEEPSHV